MVNRENLTDWVIIAGCLLALIATVGIGVHKAYLELTYPTAQEVVESIPSEMMPAGGKVWMSGFGGVMINNGGNDYVEVTDEDGQQWEFHRPHRGDKWTRTQWEKDVQP